MTQKRYISCAEVRPTSKPCFSLGTDPETPARFAQNPILGFPNDDGLLCKHTWGETLRGDRSNLLGISICVDLKTCPVAAIERYMAITCAMQVDPTDGFLFWLTTAKGAMSPLSISSEAMNSRLKMYLKEAGIDEDEMVHCFRSGCATSLALLGSAMADVICHEHVSWKRSHTANYYMQLEKVL